MNNTDLVSYCIFSYNQETYIKDCIESVLNQTYGNLEIIISDDHSSDATFEIIKKVVNQYKGPHIVKFYQNTENIGLAAHFSKVTIDYTNGDNIICLGGDDICSIDHVKIAMNYVYEFPNINLFDFSGQIIDSNGKYLEKIILKYDIKKYNLDDYLFLNEINSFCPGRLYKKEILNFFGPINNNCATEDSVMVLRSLLLGGMMRINKDLIKYRIHNRNLSSIDNVKLVNTDNIINQYIKDVNTYYSKKTFRRSTYLILLKRLNFELKVRSLLNEKNKFLKRLQLIFYKITYMTQLFLRKFSKI